MNQYQRILNSVKFAFKGLEHTIKYNQNIRIHFFFGILAVLLSIILKISPIEFDVVAVTILFVLCTEMLNTAIEEIVNLVAKDYRLEAKIAKDVCAGMVLLASFGAIIVGLLIFTPHFINLISH